MKIRFNDRILARKLRKNGYSFSEIMERIPNLSKGTLNGWLKDIELTEDQKKRLLDKIKLSAERGRLKGAFTNHQKRIEITKYIIESARSEVDKKILSPLFITGNMLYWAEGGKTGEKISFVNSDPIMIQLMMKWFREVCKVAETKFRIALHIMTLHNKNESERFWSQVTGVSLTNFNKTIIKQTLLKGKRNPSYMGTCIIRISDKNLFRKMKGWKLGILETYNINTSAHSSVDRANRF